MFVTWLEFHVFFFTSWVKSQNFCQAATCCQEARDCNVGDPKVQKMVRSSMVPIPGLMDGSPIDLLGCTVAKGLFCQGTFIFGWQFEIREHKGELRSRFWYSPALEVWSQVFIHKDNVWAMSMCYFNFFLAFTFVNLDALPEKTVLKTLTHRSCRTMNTRVSYWICWGNILGT